MAFAALDINVPATTYRLFSFFLNPPQQSRRSVFAERPVLAGRTVDDLYDAVRNDGEDDDDLVGRTQLDHSLRPSEPGGRFHVRDPPDPSGPQSPAPVPRPVDRWQGDTS